MKKMRIRKWKFIIGGIFLLNHLPTVYAAESPNPQGWYLGIGLGAAVGAQSDLSADSSRAQLVNRKGVHANDSVVVQLQSSYLPPDSYFGVSFLAEFNSYAYATGGSDNQSGFYVVPKLRLPFSKFEFWVGPAIGGMLTQISGGVVSDGGYIATNDESDQFNFAIQPRLGLDAILSPSLRIGLFAAYCTAKGSTTGKVTDIGNGTETDIHLNIDHRQWFSIGLSLAYQF